MPSQSFPFRTGLLREAPALLALALAVVIVYFPRASPASGTRALLGSDNQILHMRRIEFARDALFGPRHALPAWYPRELCGTPFRANAQSFPFIPTRLIVFAFADPLHLFTYAVILAAVLSAWFTNFYCRQIGLGRLGAAVAGWTFACAGFFAGRIIPGHLPLHEAYPALPLLLWLAEVALQRFEHHRRAIVPLALLALATTCMALAGHPQLPIYAMIVTALYVIVRLAWRATFTIGATMAMGVGMAAFALWPMFLLVGRSTRVLPLGPSSNDIPLYHGRLGAFFFPWKDGVPGLLAGLKVAPAFHGYAQDAVFWDTLFYVGWLPWIAVVSLALTRAGREEVRRRLWIFWLLIGVGSVLLALPEWQSLMHRIPGTFLRSPARQLYITTFVLALVLGLATDVLLRTRRSVLVIGLVLVALAIHAFDLARFSRTFVRPADPPSQPSPRMVEQIKSIVGDGRIGIDCGNYNVLNRRLDDVGFFDSVLLARPYRALMSLTNAPAGLNEELIDGGVLSLRALRATGVRLLITKVKRPRLQALHSSQEANIYLIGDQAAPRVAFYPWWRTLFLGDDEIQQNLRREDFDLSALLMLPKNAKPESQPTGTGDPGQPQLVYERVSSDEIRVKATVPSAGYLRILESFDPGWRATVDGAPARILPANDAFCAVFLNPGSHEVRLIYHTPGAIAGVVVSLASALALFAFLAFISPRPARTDPNGA